MRLDLIIRRADCDASGNLKVKKLVRSYGIQTVLSSNITRNRNVFKHTSVFIICNGHIRNP